jgi:hypothetical protein
MMKKVNWIIDKFLFDEYEDKLANSIKNSGMNVYFFDDTKNHDVQTFVNKKFTDDDIVIFHGSLNHGRRILKQPVYPGVFLTLDNYECYKYYGQYGDNLLNSDYLMMGLNDVLRNKEKIFDLFKTNNVFIRPSNGFKSFTGQLLPKDNFDIEFDVLTKSYGGLESDILVLLSSEKEIEEEYRFIVIDGEVISGALYMDKDSRSRWEPYYDKPCLDKNAFEFAIKMSKIYQPDKAFNMDVCRLSSGEYKLMEINSFCCGSLYGNDYDIIVDKVNKLCIDEYNDIFTV